MTTLYGTSLPPGLESSTKGELRIRIDKLILDDEVLNNNPLLQTSFAQNIKNNTTDLKAHKARNTRNSNMILTNSNTADNTNRVGGGGIHDCTSISNNNSNSSNSNSSSFINKRKFNIPVDYCSVTPHFWGEAKPSASCVPATPHQLQRGAITIIYLVKVKESAFAEYLHNMTCSSHRGLHLDVFVPSSYSGRKPIFVGQCVIDLDDLSATKHLDGWFTLTHNTNVDFNELSNENDKKQETSTRLQNENGIVPNAKMHDELTAISTSIPIGRVKVSFQLVYFSKAPIRLLHKKKSNRVSFILPSKENEPNAQDNKSNNKNSENNNKDHGYDETAQKLSSSTPVKVALDQNISSVRKTDQASLNDEKRNEENSKNKLAEHRESYSEEEEENKREEKQQKENKRDKVDLTLETEITNNVVKHADKNISKTNAQGKEYEGEVESNKVNSYNNKGNDKNDDDTSESNNKGQEYGAKSEQTALPLAFTTTSSSPFASTLDELLHKSKLLRDRMAQAITLDSKVKRSTKAVHENNIGASFENKKKNVKNINTVNNGIRTNEKLSHPSTVIVMDSSSESSSTVDANNSDSNENDDDDDIVYTSELSDDEDRLLQLSRQRSLDTNTAHTPVHQTPTPKDKLRSHTNNELTSAHTSHVRLISSAQPTLFARDNSMLNHKAMSLPVDYMRKRNIMGCTLVELNFSNLSFAANMKTTDLSKLRINVKLSADITTSTPTAGPFSSFVHALPLRQPSICLSFDIQSYSEDVSRLVIEFFKVSTVNRSVRGGSTMYKTHLSSSSSHSSISTSSSSSCESESLPHPAAAAAADVLVHTPKRNNHQDPKNNRPMYSNQMENDHHKYNHHYKQNKNVRKESRYAKRHEIEETTDTSHKLHLAAPSTNTCRDVISEELLGLCIVGLYSQERTIALRDPVEDVVNVYAHLQLALREPINIISDSKKTNKHENSRSNNVDDEEVENSNTVNAKKLSSNNNNSSSNSHVVHTIPPLSPEREEQEMYSNKRDDYHHHHHRHHERSIGQEKSCHTYALNSNKHEEHVPWLPSKRSNSSGLQGNAYRFNHCINRKHITETKKCIRLRVEIVNAQDIPLVCITKDESAQQHVVHPTPIHHSTDVKEHQELTRYTKPNTFCVIDDVYMKSNMPCSNGRNGCSDNCELDYLSPVEDWYVESYTNGYYDRSAVIWHNQRPQYNFSSVLTILESNGTCTRECDVAKEQANSTIHHSTIYTGKTNSKMLSTLQELRLTLWHCALPQQNTTPNKNIKVMSYAERDVGIDKDKHHENFSKSVMPFDPNNETMFWAHSGELGECRIDLQPLRYLPTLDGYYSVVTKKRNNSSNIINNNIDEDWPKSDVYQSSTGEQIIGYLHVCISLL